MHSYCGACYSDWMVKSTECPICRKTVERISKNCLINNIVESFLKKNSKKKRSDSEIKIMNEKNKIDQDMVQIVYFKKLKRLFSFLRITQKVIPRLKSFKMTTKVITI